MSLWRGSVIEEKTADGLGHSWDLLSQWNVFVEFGAVFWTFAPFSKNVDLILQPRAFHFFKTDIHGLSPVYRAQDSHVCVLCCAVAMGAKDLPSGQ